MSAPDFNRALRRTAMLALVALLPACTRHDTSLEEVPTAIPPDSDARQASGVPTRFVLPAIPNGTNCQSPIGDPRSGARLRLVRQWNGRGDYEVPAGYYGATVNELLRVDCVRGSPIGLIRR